MQELPQFLAEIFPGKTYDSLRNIYGFASKVNCNNLTLKYNKTNNKGMSVNKITCKSLKKRLDFEKLHLLPKKYFIPNYKYFYTDIFVRHFATPQCLTGSLTGVIGNCEASDSGWCQLG